MKVTGIIAEYNPLHNGHVYHIEKTREITGCDAIVAAMSGDYVQRGEPAIMDKWKRAELALRSGADLIIEIPVLYCLGNAGQYAGAGVNLLESLGCTEYISFGSECGDIELLRSISGFLRRHRTDIDLAIRTLTKKGYNYPVAREKAYEAIRKNPHILAGDESVGAGDRIEPVVGDARIARELRVLESPNDILAMEYIGAMDKAVPVVVKREGAGYSDPYDIKFDYQSASALRAQTLDGRNISRYIPECTAEAMGFLGAEENRSHLTGPDRDKWIDMLRYAVLSTPAQVIEDCPSGGEGIANLMKSEIMKTDSWTQFVRRVKSKRYTYTRISRLCAQVLLGITREKYGMASTGFSGNTGYIRVLGFNDRGKELLAEIRNKDTASIPVITNINKERHLLSDEAQEILDLDIHADDIYNLITGRNMTTYSDHRIVPVMI